MMKRKTIGYELLRIYVRFAFWLTHRKVVVTGRENIPSGKPIIFAANHQNALMDPLALVCTNKLQTVWLARADIFKSKKARPFLKFLKIWPVYRIRDGKDNLANNDEIFDKVAELLENKQSVALFPEAAHSGKRQMLPHKKAIPRIAFETVAKNNFQLDLQIVPVGIYYSHYWKLNRTLIVRYGQPIQVKNYWLDYELNPQKAMLDLRDEIHQQLLPLVIDISSKEKYNEYELIREIAGKRPEVKFFSRNKTLKQFDADKELISKLELLERTSPDSFSEIIHQLDEYQQSLAASKITDCQVVSSQKSGIFSSTVKILLSLISLPVFVIGSLFNLIPYFIPRTQVKRKIKDKAFISSFNFVLGLIIYPIYYLILYLAVLQPRYPMRISLLFILLLPFLGKAAYALFQFYQSVIQEGKYLLLSKKYKLKVDELIKKRWILVELVREKLDF